jgi:hypothetical protein
MRYVYSVIRFVPDPARGEFINVGAIVGSEESSEWQIRQVANPQRARRLDERGTLAAVWSFIEGVGRQIDAYDEQALLPPDAHLSEEWLTELHVRHRNLVQLTPPAPIVASSADEALDQVFEHLVVDPARRRHRFAKKHAALAAVRAAYRRNEIDPRRVRERVDLRSDQFHEPIDFALTNGNVVQLVQTWSFQLPNQAALGERIKSWAWAIHHLKRSGGEITTAQNERFVVPSTVDVAVVYVPPEHDRAATAFADSRYVFDQVSVRAVPVEAADAEVGEQARRLIRGKSDEERDDIPW